MWSRLAGLILLLTLGCACAAERNVTVSRIDAASYTKRVALVIGNGRYAGVPLRNSVNDARDMAGALRRLGFAVIEKTDVSQKEMNRAITQFGEKLGSDTIALFFYAGHGIQVKGKNYLVPIDAQIASEASVRSETVDVDALLEQLGTSPFNIVILDACRNNPFERRFRGSGGGLAQMDAPKGTLIAYATAPGKVASDGEGRNGLYTQELLKQMQTPGLSVEGMFKRVRAGVARATSDNQIPWEASSLTGDFYFRPDPGRHGAVALAEPSPTSVPPSIDAIEMVMWDSIKNSSNHADYEEYLRQYPDGRFAVLAKNKIAALSPTARMQGWLGTWQMNANYSIQCRLNSLFKEPWSHSPVASTRLVYVTVRQATADGGAEAVVNLGSNKDGEITAPRWVGTASGQTLRLAPTAAPNVKKGIRVSYQGDLTLSRSDSRYTAKLNYFLESTDMEAALELRPCRHRYSFDAPVIRKEQSSANQSPQAAAPAARSYMGLKLNKIADGSDTELGYKVVVADIAAGSPAEAAGIQKGDVVMTFDGERLTNPDQVAKRLAESDDGATVALKLRRDGKDIEVTVILRSRQPR